MASDNRRVRLRQRDHVRFPPKRNRLTTRDAAGGVVAGLTLAADRPRCGAGQPRVGQSSRSPNARLWIELPCLPGGCSLSGLIQQWKSCDGLKDRGLRRGLTLAGFHPGIFLVDHVDPAAAAYQPAVLVTHLCGAEAIADFHGSLFPSFALSAKRKRKRRGRAGLRRCQAMAAG